MLGVSTVTAKKIAIERLGPRDASEIEGLFKAAERRIDRGFLAQRLSGEYAEMLSRDDAVVVGARSGGELIGYSACYRIYHQPYPEIVFLKKLNAAKTVVYHGAGTVIDSSQEGRLLSRRLFLARREELRKRNVRHFLGLIAVGNWLSLGNALYAGAVLVGLAHDRTALNYVAYTGDFAGHILRSHARLVDWFDTAAHRELFRGGFVAAGLKSKASGKDGRPKQHYFVFRPLSEDPECLS